MLSFYKKFQWIRKCRHVSPVLWRHENRQENQQNFPRCGDGQSAEIRVLFWDMVSITNPRKPEEPTEHGISASNHNWVSSARHYGYCDCIWSKYVRALNAAFRNDKTTLVLPFKYEYNFCDDLGRNDDVAWFPWSSALDSPKIIKFWSVSIDSFYFG